MKKRNWVIMMSAAALAMASVTGCSSQNGGETTAKVENAGGSKDGASADGVKEITIHIQVLQFFCQINADCLCPCFDSFFAVVPCVIGLLKVLHEIFNPVGIV